MSEDPPRRLRRDADRNRRLLVDTGSEVFQEQGVGASLAEIARRAGVGIGTLYRHFPQREDLIRAIVDADLEQIASIAESAMEHHDPWQALYEFCVAQTERANARRVIRELLILQDSHASGRRFLSTLTRLVDRARLAGVIRPGIVAEDYVLILSLVSRSLELTGKVDPDQWRRQLAIVLDGTRADGQQTPLPVGPIGTDRLGEGISQLAKSTLDRTGKPRPTPR